MTVAVNVPSPTVGAMFDAVTVIVTSPTRRPVGKTRVTAHGELEVVIA